VPEEEKGKEEEGESEVEHQRLEIRDLFDNLLHAG
jgi:hypothetical protein